MKYFILIPIMLIFTACENSKSNDIIDLDWMLPEPQIIYVDKNCSCDDANAYLDDLEKQIDLSSVKMNHYVDHVLIDENFATIVDINGQLTTKNHVELPEFTGSVMKHVLIVEFDQIK